MNILGHFLFSLALVLAFLTFIETFESLDTFRSAQEQMVLASRADEASDALLDQIAPAAGVAP
jgi:hypothetical protein